MKLDVYNKEGKKISRQVNLDKSVFGVKPNEHCLYLAVKAELAAKRQGTSKSKSKSDFPKGNGIFVGKTNPALSRIVDFPEIQC